MRYPLIFELETDFKTERVLSETINTVNALANVVSQIVIEQNLDTFIKANKQIYSLVRDTYPRVSSEMLIETIKTVCSEVKESNDSLPHYSNNRSVKYSQRLISYRNYLNKEIITLWTTYGRKKFEYKIVNNIDGVELVDYNSLSFVYLVKFEDKFYIIQYVQVEDTKLIENLLK
jgi:hypothetical protein